jgi:hypothetical protein
MSGRYQGHELVRLQLVAVLCVETLREALRVEPADVAQLGEKSAFGLHDGC